MELTLPQVANLFDVTENMVTRWVQQDNLPVHEINSQYRFDRAELLEWAALHKTRISPRIFCEVNGDRVAHMSLADAIERGGVTRQAGAKSREDVYRLVLADMTLPAGMDLATLLELLKAREETEGTAIGDGIAIPHPRYPVVLPGNGSTVRVCFLDQPLDFKAADGKPVHTFFFMICPTVHEHLQLLSRLASVLRREDFRRLLADRPDRTRLVSAVRAEEHAFGEPDDV